MSAKSKINPKLDNYVIFIFFVIVAILSLGYIVAIFFTNFTQTVTVVIPIAQSKDKEPKNPKLTLETISKNSNKIDLSVLDKLLKEEILFTPTLLNPTILDKYDFIKLNKKFLIDIAKKDDFTYFIYKTASENIIEFCNTQMLLATKPQCKDLVAFENNFYDTVYSIFKLNSADNKSVLNKTFIVNSNLFDIVFKDENLVLKNIKVKDITKHYYNFLIL